MRLKSRRPMEMPIQTRSQEKFIWGRVIRMFLRLKRARPSVCRFPKEFKSTSTNPSTPLEKNTLNLTTKRKIQLAS
jgi:hypothetical protein